ncbi:MAG TPA: 3-hydroxybutyryl-CoA dehydrogenase [bacterium]|nr:3-hydroxybutyryl-CoA dehydrogenase [bacterium]
MAFRKIGVLGCGLMGSRIAQVSAAAGYEVWVREIEQRFLDKGFDALKKSMSREVEKGKLKSEDMENTLARLHGTLNLEDLRDCGLIIEAIVEDIQVKRDLFSTLDRLCVPETILASNTSSLTVIEMAAATQRADRIVGLYFFNPAHFMKLVEVVQTIATSAETFRQAFDFVRSIGKVPIAAKDRSGFIVNLLLVPYLLDAVRALESGLATVEDIDAGMELGCGYPMGPFTLLDFVGLDTTYRIANIMYEEYRDGKYAPPPLLRKMVLAGYFGMKSGKGFYDYAGEKPVVNPMVI